MRCHTNITSDDVAKHYETMLCQACRYLTAEQIDSLRGDSGIYDGLMWYTQHLFLDACHSESTYSERHIATHELHRLGYEIRPTEYGRELVKI
jgi:hypothetical protein